MPLVDINEDASKQKMFSLSVDPTRTVGSKSNKSGREESIKLYVWGHPVTVRDKGLYFHLHGLLGFIWQIE